MSAVLERVRRAPGVVDLVPAAPIDPAALHAAADAWPDGQPDRVWYAAYGSNLLRARFLTYLLGGRPDGSARTYPPSDHPRHPVDEMALVLPGSARFAREAASWGGGGVAFWDPDSGAGTAARGWLIDSDQFAELLHLENGGADRRRPTVPAELWRRGVCVVGPGWYPRLLVVGLVAGDPVVTFTSAVEDDRLPASAPGHAYADVVARGLAETFASPDRGGVDLTSARELVRELAPSGR